MCPPARARASAGRRPDPPRAKLAAPDDGLDEDHPGHAVVDRRKVEVARGGPPLHLGAQSLLPLTRDPRKIPPAPPSSIVGKWRLRGAGRPSPSAQMARNAS